MEVQENKVALVTGANQGVGFQIAKALAQNGYIVFVGSRNLQNGVAAAEKIGGKSQAIQIDVTDKNSVEHAAAKVQQEFGKLDLLVNDLIIVEEKAVEQMIPLYKAQLLSYLKLAQKPKGLLINFNCENIRDHMVSLVTKDFALLPKDTFNNNFA